MRLILRHANRGTLRLTAMSGALEGLTMLYRESWTANCTSSLRAGGRLGHARLRTRRATKKNGDQKQ